MPATKQKRYVARLLDARLGALLANLPAVLVVGARATGRTTTAARHARTIVRLDRTQEALAFRADPDAALQGLAEPILLDEWQEVPEVLGAVKRAVDEDFRGGRFILTGSVRADLEAATWPGTGRVVRLNLHGLSVRELQGATARPGLLERARTGPIDPERFRATDAPDLRGYIDLMLRSGFPEAALRLAPEQRVAWLGSYADAIVTRDASLVDAGRDPDRLRRYLTAFAAITGQVVEDKTIWEGAGIDRRTAQAYEQLLRNLAVVDVLPAWSGNRLKQLTRSPKRFLADAALAAALLDRDAAGILREGVLLGPLLESFAVAQLRAETSALERPPRLHHLRSRGGRHEVDLVVELSHDRLLGIEVKASSAPGTESARHLRWLQDQLGDRFIGGLVLHTGPRSWRLGPGIVAAPIAALWS